MRPTKRTYGAPPTPLALMLLMLLFGLVSPAPALAQHFDVLIRGGRVIDGTGNDWFRADVAISQGRIVQLSRRPLDASSAARVIANFPRGRKHSRPTAQNA